MNASELKRDEIRQALSDPWRVCELLGLTEGAKRQAGGLSIRCPLHLEQNPSCSVTHGDGGGIRVRCFAGCDFGGAKDGGDVFALVAAAHRLSVRQDFPRVLEIAAGLAGISTAPPIPRLAAVPAATPDMTAEWNALPPIDADTWEYLRGRGLEDAAEWCRSAATNSIGMTGSLAGDGFRLAVALKDATGRVVGYQLRALERHDFRVIGQSNAGLFGEPEKVATCKNVLVCEGLSDTLAALCGMAARKDLAIVGIAGVQAAAALWTLPLSGKRVMIATDADEAGDKAAQTISEALERAKGKPVRIRAEGGKDLAELHARGVSLLDYCRTAVGRSAGFASVADRVAGERVERAAIVAKGLPFGVKCLDVTLGAILPTDEVLVGAATGIGKTELAKIVAQQNAMDGRRVYGVFLEAEPKEIERRIKFNVLSQLLVGKNRWPLVRNRWNFHDWYHGKLDDLWLSLEGEAEDLMRGLKNLHTFYRIKDFTANDFARMFDAIADEAELVLLDHFHYLDDDDRDGTASQRRSAKKIRDAVLTAQKALLVVAHIRKAERKGKQIIPLADDFSGASELVKAATKAVMIAPARDVERPSPGLWPTFINPVKNRLDGQRARFGSLTYYNAAAGCYSDDFELGTVSMSGDEFKAIPRHQWPDWATAAYRSTDNG
jgi:5S rRNA maturation endonuclease (ribonuclease M5)